MTTEQKTMTTEQKEKLMLSDDLTAYINEKHTQEECIGFIDGYNAAITKLKLLGIADVSDCYSELQMKDCFEAGVYYERSCAAHEDAKKEKGPRILMGNDTTDFSEFMHRLNNR